MTTKELGFFTFYYYYHFHYNASFAWSTEIQYFFFCNSLSVVHFSFNYIYYCCFFSSFFFSFWLLFAKLHLSFSYGFVKARFLQMWEPDGKILMKLNWPGNIRTNCDIGILCKSIRTTEDNWIDYWKSVETIDQSAPYRRAFFFEIHLAVFPWFQFGMEKKMFDPFGLTFSVYGEQLVTTDEKKQKNNNHI